MSSVNEKPTAKSSRSAGEASITACETPLYSSATGTSSATQSVPATATAPHRSLHRHLARAGRRWVRSMTSMCSAAYFPTTAEAASRCGSCSLLKRA